MLLIKVNFLFWVHRNAKAKRLMFHFLSGLFFYFSLEKKEGEGLLCCMNSLPGVDAFHQWRVWVLFLTITQRGSPAKITSLISPAERKWQKTPQGLWSFSPYCVFHSWGWIIPGVSFQQSCLQSALVKRPEEKCNKWICLQNQQVWNRSQWLGELLFCIPPCPCY